MVEIKESKILIRLINVTNSIASLYNKLIKLELDNKKESVEYKNILDSLQLAKEVEDLIYNDNCLTYDKCISLFDDLYEKCNYNNDNEDMLINNYSKLTLKRIVGKLDKKSLENTKEVTKRYHEDNDKTVNEFDISSDEFYETYDKAIKMADYIQNEYYHAVLLIIKELNNRLSINMKYHLAFTNEKIENIMLDNNFNFFNGIISFNDTVKSEIRVEEKEYIRALRDYLKERLDFEINKILEITDEEFQDERISSLIIIRQYMIRGSLLLMSDKYINELEKSLKEYINIEKCEDFTIGGKRIIDTIKKVRKDKIKYYVKKLKI